MHYLYVGGTIKHTYAKKLKQIHNYLYIHIKLCVDRRHGLMISMYTNTLVLKQNKGHNQCLSIEVLFLWFLVCVCEYIYIAMPTWHLEESYNFRRISNSKLYDRQDWKYECVMLLICYIFFYPLFLISLHGDNCYDYVHIIILYDIDNCMWPPENMFLWDFLAISWRMLQAKKILMLYFD